MTDKKPVDEEAIGRPGPWGEGRYESDKLPIDQSVLTPPGTAPANDHPAVSTPVTRRDYETPGFESDPSEPPGGDGG